MIISDPIIDEDSAPIADYSTDIHRHLNHLQQTLIKTIGQPTSEHILDNRKVVLSEQKEF
jgi:hypothetical protein